MSIYHPTLALKTSPQNEHLRVDNTILLQLQSWYSYCLKSFLCRDFQNMHLKDFHPPTDQQGYTGYRCTASSFKTSQFSTEHVVNPNLAYIPI
jgi:hypothetical protein